MAKTWTEGWLPDGTHIHVDEDPYVGNGKVRVDGVEAPLMSREECLKIDAPYATSRLRDGGTTIVHTTKGKLFCRRTMGREHYDVWQGQRLLTERPGDG